MKLPKIPAHWTWIDVSQLGKSDKPAVKAGPFGSALKKEFYTQSGFRIYGQEQVIAGDLSYGNYYIDEQRFQKLKSCEIDVNDILISLVGTFGKILIVPDRFEPGIINPRLVRLSLDPEKINPYFFSRFFESPLAQLQMKLESHGGTMGILNAKNISSLCIPLPPLDEQRRIAAILDKADAVRRKRKEAIALTEDLLRSTFLEMFGDPGTNPKGWEIRPLRSVVRTIISGWSAKGEEREIEHDEWGVLKISAVTSGQFLPQKHKAVGNPPFPKPVVVPRKGDLLFSRANTRELVAAVCLVEKDCERLFLPDKLWKIQTDTSSVNVEYLKFLVSEPKYRDLITRKATGTSGSMLNISQKKLLEMLAPIPPIRVQNDFATYVWQTFATRKRLIDALTKSEVLFNSLLQRAFRGDL